MCMFCASIPAVAAVGASVHTKQKQQKQEAEARGETLKKPVIPAGPATAAAVALLAVGSLVVHTRFVI
jgi:hypothetical protein